MNETVQKPPRSFETPTSRVKPPGATSEPAAPRTTEQFVVTRNVASGDIVSIETIDPNGQRATISEDALRAIAGQDEFQELAAALDDAFDSGMAMLFEDSTDDDDLTDDDPPERSALIRALLVALAGRSAQRRLAKSREKLLHKLILRRLVRRYALRQRLAVS
jgi:hypothetical protein